MVTPEHVVIAAMVKGVVKWYDTRKGVGYITPDGSNKDIFVCKSGIRVKKGTPRILRKGNVVKFVIEQGLRGKEARKVVPIKTLNKTMTNTVHDQVKITPFLRDALNNVQKRKPKGGIFESKHYANKSNTSGSRNRDTTVRPISEGDGYQSPGLIENTNPSKKPVKVIDPYGEKKVKVSTEPESEEEKRLRLRDLRMSND